MKVLLLSAYSAGSHMHWQNALQQMMPQWQWRTLNLPPRHFNWRVRGNPLYWSQEARDVLEQSWDLVVATSMVDLATLRGLVPRLSQSPTLLYFHENQFAFPQTQSANSPLEAQMVSIYAALAADHIAFNSAYNRDTFITGAQALFDKLPDFVPAGVINQIQCKSSVLPVPVDIPAIQQLRESTSLSKRTSQSAALRICWLGRLEHDKGADSLLRILRQLADTELPFELGIVGQQFRNMPAEFSLIQEEFAQQLVQFGYFEQRADYLEFLVSADIALSTAQHEFQGVAVLEAVACGCLPVLPDRLAYPELFPQRFLYPSTPSDPDIEAQGAARLLASLRSESRQETTARPDISALDIEYLTSEYMNLFTQLAQSQHSQ